MSLEKAYYDYLKSSEVSETTAQAHKQITSNYYWNFFLDHGCKKVLDIGCGLGFFLEHAPHRVQAIGVDSNKFAVDECRKRGLDVRVGSAYKLPFKENGFDGAFCSHLFEHLPEPVKGFNEVHRVLKRGGLLIARVPPFNKHFYDDFTHVHPFTKKSFERIASLTGFTEICVFAHHYDIPFKNWRNPFFKLINSIIHLPVIQEGIDFLAELKGLPAKEMVLLAEKM